MKKIKIIFILVSITFSFLLLTGCFSVHDSIIKKDNATLEKLINEGDDLNAKNERGETPLILATYYRNETAVKLLLENGASVNIADNRGRKPIHFAAGGCSANIVSMLIENGANVNAIAEGWHNYTPLHYAADWNNIDAVKPLLSANANLESEDKSGSTPFLVASEAANIDMIKLLKEEGANIFKYDNFGNNALIKSSQYSPNYDKKEWILANYGEKSSIYDKFEEDSSIKSRKIVYKLLKSYMEPKIEYLYLDIQLASNKEKDMLKQTINNLEKKYSSSHNHFLDRVEFGLYEGKKALIISTELVMQYGTKINFGSFMHRLSIFNQVVYADETFNKYNKEGLKLDFIIYKEKHCTGIFGTTGCGEENEGIQYLIVNKENINKTLGKDSIGTDLSKRKDLQKGMDLSTLGIEPNGFVFVPDIN